MKALKYIFGLAIFLIILAAVGGYVFLKVEASKSKSDYVEKEKRANERIAKYLNDFKSDQQSLMNISVFQIQSGSRDAGVFLNPALHWYIDDNHIEPKTNFLDLPDATVQKFKDDNFDWLDPKNASLAAKIDFTWFKKLSDFDYWDYETQSPLGDMLAKDPLYNFMAFMPSFTQSHFFEWSKLRLMTALKQNKMKEGLADTQNLARLLYSTEDLIRSMAAARILDLNREALEKAKLSKKNVKGLTSITKEQYSSLRRMLYASAAFTSIMTSSEYKKMVPTFQVGKCVALEQAGLDYLTLYEPIMAQTFSQHYADMDQVLQQMPDCRLKRFRKVWRNKNFTMKNGGCEDVFKTVEIANSAEKKADGKCSIMNIYQVAKIPLAAQMMSYTLGSIAPPDWWEKYSNK
jgi:hypothetical protein